MIGRIRAALGVLGCGLIVGGVGLAVYSRFFASTRWLAREQLGPGHRSVFGSDDWGWDISGAPDLFATMACWVGLGMLVAVAIVVVRLVRGWDEYFGLGVGLAMAVLAAVTVLPTMAVSYHVIEVWDRLRLEYPLFGQLPTALAAGALLVMGAVLTIPIMVLPEQVRSLPPRALVVATAFGVLISAGVGVAAVRAGDDRLHTDHVTAARTDVAAQPDRLGSEKYRIAVPLIGYSQGSFGGDVVSAGAGFVVAAPEGITAYDGVTGVERWHYLRKNTHRKGNFGVQYVGASLRSLDGGAIVLARWEALGWIAFDANTGEISWQDSDFTRDIADRDQAYELVSGGTSDAPTVLTLVGRDRIRSYDPRTGARIWSTDLSERNCGSSALRGSVATGTAIYRVAECSDQKEVWATATAFDTRTGAVLGTRELARHPSRSRDEIGVEVQALSDLAVITWPGTVGDFRMIVRAPGQLATTPMPGEDTREPVAAPAVGPELLIGELILDGHYQHRYTVVDSDTGAEKFTLPDLADDGLHRGRVVFLPSGIIAAAGGGNREVRSWSRDDGHLVLSRPFADEGCIDTAIASAPGSLLVICGREQSAQLVAYGPA